LRGGLGLGCGNGETGTVRAKQLFDGVVVQSGRFGGDMGAALTAAAFPPGYERLAHWLVSLVRGVVSGRFVNSMTFVAGPSFIVKNYFRRNEIISKYRALVVC
jgi:hypothetical protein